jgi:hypothetical protein
MLLLYPSAETETSHNHLPWMTLLFLVMVAGYFAFSFQRQQASYLNQKQLFRSQIEQILNNALADGRLRIEHFERAQFSPDTLVDPEYRELYPANAVTAYEQLQALKAPRESISQQPLPQRLNLLLTWPSWYWLVIGSLLLIPPAFLWEHLFSIIFVLPTFAIAAIAALFGSDSALANLWPAPEQAWLSFALILAWLPTFNRPWAKIEIALKIWFSSKTLFEIEVPVAVFAGAFTAWIWFGSENQTLYTVAPMVLAGPIAFALLLSFPMRLLPNKERAPKVGKLGDVEAKRGKVESLFAEERGAEAEQLLRELSTDATTQEDHRWIARSAWHHDLPELAAIHYRRHLTMIIEADALEKAIPVVEEMIQRNIPVSPGILLEILDYALAKYKLKLAEKILSSYRTHPKVSEGEALAATEQFAEVLMMSEKPSRTSMISLKDWLERHMPDHPLLKSIIQQLQAHAGGAQLSSNYGAQRVHRHVEIDLHSIMGNFTEVRIKGQQKRQRIPWTAVTALYGYCIVSHTQGLYGCLVINFRNKLFACHFGRRNIFMTSSDGKPMNFESAWELLFKETPEDIPRVAIESFEQFIRPEDSEAAVDSFLEAKLTPTI